MESSSKRKQTAKQPASQNGKKPTKRGKNNQKEQTYYRVDDKLTTRKPRRNHVTFRVKSVGSTNSTNVKNFLKHVLIDIKEINFLRNDVGFMLHDKYGDDHSATSIVPIEEGRIFYSWVHLPYSELNNTLPEDVGATVFAFDLAYVRRLMTNAECENIINVLKKEVDVHVYVRRPFEEAVLPILANVEVLTK